MSSRSEVPRRPQVFAWSWAALALLSALGCTLAGEPSASQDPQDPQDPADPKLPSGQLGRPTQAASLDLERLIGAPEADELLSGMVVGAQGQMIFSAHGAGLLDRFGPDMLVGRVNADGSKAWLKILSTEHSERSPDAGQNAQTGGTSQSIALDERGDVYVVGAWATSKTPNHFRVMLLKIDGASGELRWSRVWSPSANLNIASSSAQGYGLAVAADRVYVTGATHGEAYASILVVDARQGEVLQAHALEINPTYNDRGYTIQAAPGEPGAVYVGGNGNGRAWVGKLSGVDTDSPRVQWLKQVELGVGGNINALSLDARGDLYLSCDRRGVETFFSAIKLSPDGQLRWGRTFEGRRNDRNTIHSVQVQGDLVLLAGMTAQDGFDTVFGDGLVVALNLEGELRWAMMHVTGKGDQEAAEHRVKAAWITDGYLHVATQAGARQSNTSRFVGQWIEAASTTPGHATLTEYKPRLTDLTAQTSWIPIPSALVEPFDASLHARFVYEDAPEDVLVQEASAKRDGRPPDEDILLSKLKLR